MRLKGCNVVALSVRPSVDRDLFASGDPDDSEDVDEVALCPWAVSNRMVEDSRGVRPR